MVLFSLGIIVTVFLKMKLKRLTSLRGKWKSFRSISSYLFPYSVVYMLYLEYENKSLLKFFSCLGTETLILKKRNRYYIAKECVDTVVSK